MIVSHSLRRSFLSIKGIYYQATIQGQDVLWLVPYRFVQRTGGDIDFRIMGTFVEFYTTLLGFVNYRLYTSIGLVYPPKYNAKIDEQGGELSAFQLEGKSLATHEAVTNGDAPAEANPEAQAIADKIAAMPDTEEEQEKQTALAPVDEDGNTEGIDKFETTAPDGDILPQPEASSAEVASLFAPFTFYLARETPRAPLEFILKAFGCKRVGWDSTLGDGAFTSNESDPTITHQIVDRPSLSAGDNQDAPGSANTAEGTTKVQWPRSTMPGRTYVQPQWVWDCINQGKLLRPDLYAPGAELPPHLSPWVKPKKGEYDPSLPLQAQELEGEAEAFEDEDEDEDEQEDADIDVVGDGDENEHMMDRESSVEAGEGMDVASSEDEEDEDEDEDEQAKPATEDWEGFGSDAESDISEGEAGRLQRQRELEAEATGKPLEPADDSKRAKNAAIRKKAEKKRREEEEERERQKMMLSSKKRKLLKRIEYGANKRDAEAENLRRKKRRLEKAKAAAEAI